ncbi:MAG TPA: hypothetical protein VKZ63_02680 [Kofleriaceae bacterium]|nr:hypothetical protein [Kofleriaceae bacterium]
MTAAAGACHRAPPRDSFRVTVSVRSDAGDPIAGAEIASARRVVGKTGAAGSLVLDLRAREGAQVPLRASCPAGYHSPDATALVLRRLRGGAATEPAPLAVSFVCRPTTRQAAVVLRAAGQPDLPVHLHGTELARTDEHGIAHALVTAPAGSTLTLTLDTSGRPRLRPQNPSLTIRLDDADDLFVLDQPFEVEEPPQDRKPPRRRRRAARPAPPPRPERIGGRARRVGR